MPFTTSQRKNHAHIQEWLYHHYPHASRYSRAMATRLIMGHRVVGDSNRLGHALAYEMAQEFIKHHRTMGK